VLAKIAAMECESGITPSYVGLEPSAMLSCPEWPVSVWQVG